MTMDDSEKPKHMPFIKATFEARAPLFVMLLVQNVGNAAALDVRMKIQLESRALNEFQTEVLLPLLMPRQKIRFFLPETNIKSLAEKEESVTLTLHGTCKNICGKEFPIDDTINVKEVMQSWLRADIALEETIENRLSVVAERIERLERSVEGMLRNGVLVKTKQDQRQEQEEMKRWYEEQKQKREGEKEKTSSAS